ncbi:tripartite tricarboxylate transporter substrate-binding protein [Muricoccus radiodurans]|uniref:tripartite tricarboxylate transporter substrate-binding protein n=1 Tax=Muricoccus radiodurans TaxID=2231721 RepID=UPI003CF2A11D
MRRAILAGLLGLSLGAPPAGAAEVLRLLSGFAPGGPVDQIARVIAPTLGTELGRTVVIETRAGAGGTIAAQAVARAPADGNTLLITTSSLVITAGTVPNLPYDPRRDLEPLYYLGPVQTMLVARPSLGVRSMADLVAMARRGQRLSYGSTGVGSTMHIGGELFNIATGSQATHVPYRGAAPAITDLVAGNIDMLNADIPVLRPFVLDRRVVPLVVYDTQRSPHLPDVPTATEVGLPALDMSNWYAVLAPAGVPDAVLRELEAGLARTRANPEVAARLAEAGFGAPLDRAAFRAKFAADYDRWVPFVQRAGIRSE